MPRKALSRWWPVWAQERRREHQALLPAPVLVAAPAGVAIWQWRYADPAKWNVFKSADGGVTWQYENFVVGSARQYTPVSGATFVFVVGVDANGKEITKRSNWVRTDDALTLVPMTVAGLKLWARFESLGGLLEGDKVGTWRDSSGNGRDLIQANTAWQPVIRNESATGVGLLFDGSNDVLVTAANVLNTNQSTIFIVARPLFTSSHDVLGTGGTASGDILLMIYGDRMRGHSWRGAPDNVTDGSSMIHNGAYAIFEQEVTATDLILRLNGNTEATHVMTGTPAGVSKPIYLGSRNNSWFFNGLVRDVLVYEGNPSAADKTRIRNFLISTYGIPTPYPPPPPPGAPFDLGGNPDGGDVYLYWDLSESRYATGVELERKPAAAPDSSFAVVDVLGLETEYYDVGISPQAVTYRMRAYNAGGYSAYSNTVTVTF